MVGDEPCRLLAPPKMCQLSIPGLVADAVASVFSMKLPPVTGKPLKPATGVPLAVITYVAALMMPAWETSVYLVDGVSGADVVNTTSTWSVLLEKLGPCTCRCTWRTWLRQAADMRPTMLQSAFSWGFPERSEQWFDEGLCSKVGRKLRDRYTAQFLRQTEDDETIQDINGRSDARQFWTQRNRNQTELLALVT